MRLGDLDALKVVYQKWMSELDENNPEYADERNAILSCICQLEDQPSIDPESLPIVRQLQAEVSNLSNEIIDREQHSIEQHGEIHEYRDKLRETMKKLAAYTDLGVSPEQVALLMKFFKENTSAEKIAVDLKLVADSIKLDDLKKRIETVEKERDSAARCITETCAYIENTEYGDYCVKNDAPCDKCELLWRKT